MSAQYRPFDVVAVAFGEGASAKRRPALIVSNPEFEKATGLVWVAMITTPDHARRFGDIPINDQRAAGLPATSVVRASKLATLAVGKIKRRLGSLSETDRAGARVALRAAAGFS
ncbi:type II toxin-antitoxin system PemK/MazF family toxin [Phenylobacterium montanum]|uniref:Type II toxin-antitoxin system PemK/MazF family toxin n=1 Tax=Phenylobacterium montanum TaxID=2823693 RepID=A0A975G2N8_9CAUL|nr:type II toxin-antitoxin system PemK/MazF family toxin [Caulobacter sp. S6]QUD90020.1 type II toxin-antitoxin system PemK/MazF family toxin [Caulobacter sp. S6]